MGEMVRDWEPDPSVKTSPPTFPCPRPAARHPLVEQLTPLTRLMPEGRVAAVQVEPPFVVTEISGCPYAKGGPTATQLVAIAQLTPLRPKTPAGSDCGVQVAPAFVVAMRPLVPPAKQCVDVGQAMLHSS